MRTFAILSVVLFCIAGETLAESVPVQEATLVAAQKDRSDRMTVPVRIGGKGPFRFLVDTGAQATVVTAHVAQSLGLEPSGRATLIAMASRTVVDTLSLDGLEFAGRRFDALTTPLLYKEGVGADGILGLDTLQDLRVVIDFRTYTLEVTPSPASRNEDYEIVVRARRKLGQMIITDAMVDGVRTAVIIDTGSWESMANAALAKRLRKVRGAEVTSTDVTGTIVQGQLALLGRLTIGPLGLANLPASFAESPVFAALGLEKRPALILGMGNLRPFDRVAIDFASRKILFDVPRGAIFDRGRNEVTVGDGFNR